MREARGPLAALRAAARAPMFREFLRFGASTVGVQAARVGAGLVVAASLGPTLWGWWYLLNLIVAYGSLTHLGALNAMNREVPAALGRGDGAAADDLRRVALGTVIVGTGAASVLLLLAAWGAAGIVPVREVALMLMLLGAHQAYEYAAMTLKATTRFQALSSLQFVSVASYPLLAIAGAAALGLEGFILGQVLSYALLSVLARRGAGVSYAPRFDVAAARPLVAVGFPIMLVGLVYALFSSVDRWVVVAFLGAESLGHYALAIMALGAVSLLPQVVAQQYYPRVAHAWAARRDTAELRRLATQVRNMTFASVLPVVAVLIVVVPPAVRWLLPAFAPGIPALLVTVFVPLVNAIGQGYGGVLHMLDRQVWLLYAIAAAAALNAALSAALVGPLGLVGVALGSLIAFAFYGVARVVLGTLALRIEEAR
jgi:O-antigen/teichoic acid export membrane protein